MRALTGMLIVTGESWKTFALWEPGRLTPVLPQSSQASGEEGIAFQKLRIDARSIPVDARAYRSSAVESWRGGVSSPTVGSGLSIGYRGPTKNDPNHSTENHAREIWTKCKYSVAEHVVPL
jgi:hypothetical protein